MQHFLQLRRPEVASVMELQQFLPQDLFLGIRISGLMQQILQLVKIQQQHPIFVQERIHALLHRPLTVQ